MEPFQEPLRPKSFADVVNEFLKTPGYTTSQVSKYGGHDAYMETFKRKAAEMAPVEPKIEDAAPSEMEAIAAQITLAFDKAKETFMLGEPLTLTVLKDKGYSKAPHVGSEDFAPHKAYVGKRGKLIYVFKPVMVASYHLMEMDETQAEKSLVGFKEFMKENMGQILEQLRDSRKKAADDKEREAMADRYDKYEGFGSW